MYQNKKSRIFLSMLAGAMLLGNSPIITAASEVQSNSEQPTAKETPMTAEEIAHREVLQSITLKSQAENEESLINIKVQNTTGNYLPYLSIDFRVLDQDGEVLTDSTASADRINVNDSKNTGSFHVHCTFEDIAAIEIYEFRYGEPAGNGGGGYITKETDEFEIPLVYYIDDAECITEDGIVKYIWETKEEEEQTP